LRNNRERGSGDDKNEYEQAQYGILVSHDIEGLIEKFMGRTTRKDQQTC